LKRLFSFISFSVKALYNYTFTLDGTSYIKLILSFIGFLFPQTDLTIFVTESKKALKTLYLVRHAKSSWSDPTLMDIERPLNDRGKRDAPFMSVKLKEIQPDVDLIISSPAKRALKTAKIFSETLFGHRNVKTNEDLYHASADDILDVIKELDDEHNVVVLFGHNPGFTYLANHFSDNYIDNVPTCGIIGVQYEGQEWAKIDSNVCQLHHFSYPKLFKK
jgi:phosphohistidine phosphatase